MTSVMTKFEHVAVLSDGTLLSGPQYKELAESGTVIIPSKAGPRILQASDYPMQADSVVFTALSAFVEKKRS